MLLSGHTDYHPYYIIGNLKFQSKFEALSYAKLHNVTDIRYHFHDEIFSSYDWTTEPTESLSELYHQRAQQLRNQYEYLILGFSGGADSNNILQTFIDNDIHLDEIVVYHSLEGDSGNKNSFYNFETFNVALPFLNNYLKDKHTKITVIDTTQATLDYWKYVNKFNFLHYNNFCFSPNNLARNIIKVQNAELRKSYNTNKTVGYITGLDKPIVSYFDGKAFFKFNDCIDTTVSYVLHDKGYNREIDEFFYWTPNFPKIVIKQSHVLKRYYDTQNLDVALANTVPSGLGTIIKQGKTYQIDHKVLPGLLYDNWNIETPSVGKSNTGLVFSQRDIWFFNSGLAEAKSFKDAMQHFFSNIHSDYVNNNTQMTSVKHILSKPYFITKH
jgi:hypothetical protein